MWMVIAGARQAGAALIRERAERPAEQSERERAENGAEHQRRFHRVSPGTEHRDTRRA
jgi:hypothetical protein